MNELTLEWRKAMVDFHYRPGYEGIDAEGTVRASVRRNDVGSHYKGWRILIKNAKIHSVTEGVISLDDAKSLAINLLETLAPQMDE